MSQTTTSQILVRSEERRRHVRQKVCAITYLEFGDDNGGILLNLGVGGLSLQAVAKLNPAQDVTLRFGLFNGEEPITTAGRVIWLSPTRKEAGVCFVDLTESAGKVIDKWLAAQEAERLAAEWKASSAETDSATNEIHLLSPHLSVVSTVSRETPSDSQPSPSVEVPNEARLGNTLLDHASNRAKTSPVFGNYVPTLMPTRLVSYPKEQSGISPSIAPGESLEAKQPTIRVLRPSPAVPFKDVRHSDEPLPVRVDQVPVWQGPSASSVSVAKSNTALPAPNAQTWDRRNFQIAASVAACIGILLLLFMTANLSKHPISDGASGPSPDALNTSSRSAGAANSGVSVGASGGTNASSTVKPGRTQNSSLAQTKRSSIATSGVTAKPDPAPAPQQTAPQIVQQGSDSSWLEALKETFFGVQEKPKLDPAVARVSVWTDQRTGFYYCANSPYFIKPERVSLVTQGEALQSGFQPKLGTYCY